MLAIDAIERVEISVRAKISNSLCTKYGPHWYLDKQYFKNNYNHQRLLQSIRDKQNTALEDYKRECIRIDKLQSSDLNYKAFLKQKRQQESYSRHYSLTYTEPELMPESWNEDRFWHE